VALHDRLYTGPLRRHLSLAHTFVPHLTIGRVADRRGFEDALAEAAAVPLVIETLVRTVAIYSIGADGSRRVQAEIPLRA
jgi:2'-5' RNA ligase